MIILASQSPRRQQLLSFTGLPFTILPSDLPEEVDSSLSPEEQVMTLAHQKAAHIFSTHQKDVVIGSDTMVFLNGEALGKPRDEEDARRMLRALSGVTHRAVTGVSILREGEERRFSHATSITFHPLTEEMIDWYISTGEPMGNAGAYQIQNRGTIFLREMHGTVSGTMGLPMDLLTAALEDMGIPLWQKNEK